MHQSADSFHRPSLTDVAYREIRNGILRGVLAPGKKLVVNELVDEWKISNTPIKEALNRLVADELVEALPRRGMRVRIYDAAEMREIFELRALHEVHCVRLLADAVEEQPDIAEKLRSFLAESREVVAAGLDVEKLFSLDEAFHECIVGQCGNQTLIKSFNRLHAHSLTIGSNISRNCSLDRWRETQKEHEKVLRGILKHSPDEAEIAMRVHLEKTGAALLGFFEGSRQSGRLKKKG